MRNSSGKQRGETIPMMTNRDDEDHWELALMKL
jgi:hypothetical protein